MPFKLATICVFDSIINVKEANAITRVKNNNNKNLYICTSIYGEYFILKTKVMLNQNGSYLKFFKFFQIFFVYILE